MKLGPQRDRVLFEEKTSMMFQGKLAEYDEGEETVGEEVVGLCREEAPSLDTTSLALGHVCGMLIASLLHPTQAPR
jgi:hypothetical protein